MLLICNYCLTTSQMLKNSTMIEIWYFHFRDFPVSLWNLLLPWLSLKSFISFGKPAVSVESQQPQTEACQTGDLLLLWSVWVRNTYIVLSILFSWLLEQASRSSRYCLTLRSLSIYFFSTIIKTIASYWFLKTFLENVCILYGPFPIPFFAWDGFCIAITNSYIFIDCHY